MNLNDLIRMNRAERRRKVPHQRNNKKARDLRTSLNCVDDNGLTNAEYQAMLIRSLRLNYTEQS